MVYYGDNAPQLAGSVIALVVIASVAFGLRIYTRVRNGSFGMDDWSITAATVSRTATATKDEMLITQIPFAVLTAACIGGAYNGVGVHQARLDLEQTKTGMQVSTIRSHLRCLLIGIVLLLF